MWTSLCQVKIVMNLIHSQGLSHFDIWNIFTCWTVGVEVQRVPLPHTQPSHMTKPTPTPTLPHDWGPPLPPPCHMPQPPITCPHPLPHAPPLATCPIPCHMPSPPATCLHPCHLPYTLLHALTPTTCPTLSHAPTPCHMPPPPPHACDGLGWLSEMSNVKKSKRYQRCQEIVNYMSYFKRCQMLKSQTPWLWMSFIKKFNLTQWGSPQWGQF